MVFLPIVERELRVAARRRSTYWARSIVAGGALLLFGGLMAILSLQRTGAQTGPIVFSVFSWLAFMAVCAAGVLLTFDSLSEEKREGTIGLLFLTDLRGYDVVLGKLLASSLQAAYGLLAAFPILGITFLIGGVTGLEFWRLVLVLCNTLFFSLVIGVCVSTVSRDAQRALTATVLLILGIVVGFPAVDSALTGWDNTKFVPRLSYLSPFYGFLQAGQTRAVGVALNVGLVHLSSWLLLGLASFLAPRTWQEKSHNPAGKSERGRPGRFGWSAKRAALRQRWLAQNPVRWLAAREVWLGRFMWIFWGILGLLGVAVAWGIQESEAATSVSFALYFLAGFVVKLWLISQACLFFLEGARSGLLEVLLTSPLSPEQIVRGQAWALRRRFLVPTLLLLCARAILTVMQIQSVRIAAAPASGTPAGSASIVDDFFIMQMISGIGSMITVVTGMYALGWFGMWMGLISRKINPAIVKTLVFVDFLPALVLAFLQGLLMFGMSFAGMKAWEPSIIVLVGQVVADLTFIQIARRRLRTRFRAVLTRATGAPNIASLAKPPPLPFKL